MTKKVGIIGMGNVGCTVANQMVVSGTADEYVFIGHTESKTEANKVDFEDAIVNLNHYSKITIDDWSALKDADVLISTLGNVKSTQKGGSRSAELLDTSKMINGIAENINKSGFKGVLVVVSNPLDVMTTLFQELLNLPSSHIIGTGTLLDTARMKRIIGNKVGLNPKSISGEVIGEHGDSQVIVWSTVKLFGQSIYSVAKENKLDLPKIADEIKGAGLTIAKGKGFTNFGISATVVRLVNAILTDSHEELVVSNLRKNEPVSYSYPAMIGEDGVLEEGRLELTDEESAKLRASKAVIQSGFDEIKTVLNI